MTHLKYERLFGWLTLDMVVFAAANVFLIMHFSDRLYVLGDMSYFQLLVLGLAAYRAAHILSNEAVTKPLRAPFIEETKQDGKTVEEPKKRGFLGAMGLLIYCPSCTGVWVAMAFVYLYMFFPTQTFVVALLLALSAIERIVTMTMGRVKNG